MQKSDLTVVMYHYVRDLKLSRYPQIKGLDFSLFKEQILYLEKNYTFVTIEQVIATYKGDEQLPKKAVLLTFDDGYIDHFSYVFPFLYNRKIQGSFYAPVKAITEHVILDVNKIHFILAEATDISILLNEVKIQLEYYSKEYELKPFDYYFSKLAIGNRFDSKEVIFFKRLLQIELEEGLRTKITDAIFSKIIGVDQEVFSKELYMNKEQLSCMVSNGMHVGSHGYNHYWLGSLTKEEQRAEIVKSMNFIKEIGGDLNQWTICYPYGNFNDDTLSLLNEYKCSLGFSTIVDLVTIDKAQDSRYKMPRLDTNDLPKERQAATNNWYLNAH
jgi:peptidoglycan/xylan/chitin deacetylase (PgdA/CDA1 family)